MIKLCKYKSIDYNDIVLYDSATRRMLILESLKGTDYSGSVYAANKDEVEDLEGHHINSFSNFKDDISIDDLREQLHYSVVINGDTLLIRNNISIRAFNFKSMKNIHEKSGKFNVKNFDFDSIKSIKTELIFKKRLDNQ